MKLIVAARCYKGVTLPLLAFLVNIYIRTQTHGIDCFQVKITTHFITKVCLPQSSKHLVSQNNPHSSFFI